MKAPQWPLPQWVAAIRSRNLSNRELARLLIKRGEKLTTSAMLEAIRYRDIGYDVQDDRALIYEVAHRLELKELNNA